MAEEHLPFRIYVNREIECEECPFWFEDINKGYLEKDKFRCLLKAKNVTGQYGGLDFCETKVRECPFHLIPCADKPEGKCPTCNCEMCGGRDEEYVTREAIGLRSSKVHDEEEEEDSDNGHE